MENKIILPENHKRTLSVMVNNIERDFLDLKKILQDKNDYMITENILHTINDGNSKILLGLIDEMLKANGEMFFALELDSTKNTDTRIIKSKIAFHWSAIVDHSAASMIRYGKLDQSEAELVDKHIYRLLEIVNKLRSLRFD